MKLPLFRIKRSGVLVTLFALAIGASNMQGAAQALSANPATLGTSIAAPGLTCSVAAGTTPVTVTVKLVNAITAGSTATVTWTNSTGVTPNLGVGLVVTPTTQTFTPANSTSGVTFTVSLPAGCAGITAGEEVVTFAVGVNAPAGIASALSATYGVWIGTTATNTTSPLSLTMGGVALTALTPIAITCSYDPNNSETPYLAGVAQAVSVTSTVTAANGGTPYLPDSAASPGPSAALPSWLTLTSSLGAALSATVGASPGVGGVATTVASTFTVQASAAGCSGVGNGHAGAYTASTPIYLDTGTAANPQQKQFNVKLTIMPVSPLKPISVPPMSYTKNSGTPQTATVLVASNLSTLPNPFFSVYPSSLPSWLTVDNFTGTASPTKYIHFSTTSMADTLAPGNYQAFVALQVQGYGDMFVTFNLQVTNPTPTLTWSATLPAALTGQTAGSIVGNTVNLNSYTAGSSNVPTLSITLSSTDAPINYSIAFGGALQPQPANGEPTSGFAYNFGVTIPISFAYSWAAVVPGTPVTGTISITWGSQNTVTLINLSVPITAAAATLTGISPASLATATTGTFTVGLLGTGFVAPNINSSMKQTQIGTVGAGGAFTKDANINITGTTPTLMTVSLSATDAAIPFAAGGTVNIGVCNPGAAATCATVSAAATLPLTITGNPQIQGITSASTFNQVVLPLHPTLAPFDLVSIFGIGLCNTCTSPIGATLTTPNKFYPTTIPDSIVPASAKNISVGLYAVGTTSPLLASAPLLFASSNQINAVIPSTTANNSAALSGNYDVIVTYGANMSNPFTINIQPSDPGIFTVGSDGTGDGAILANGIVTSSTNPAGVRTIGVDNHSLAATVSDWVQIYMTGLGAPTSAGADDGTGNATTCIATGANSSNTTTASILPSAGYLGLLNSSNGLTALTGAWSIDGAIIQTAMINVGLPPCLTTVPAVTIDGVTTATPTVNQAAPYAGWVGDSVAGLYQVNVLLPTTTALMAADNTLSLAKTPWHVPVQVNAGTVDSPVLSQNNVMIWVTPSLLVSPPTSLQGQVGTPWAGGNVVATLGTPTYLLSTTTGTLPQGLFMATDGTITGTPTVNTANGQYTVTVTATDSLGLTGKVTFTISIQPGLFLTFAADAAATGVLPTVTFARAIWNSAHALATITPTSGTGPYTFTSVTSSTNAAPLALPLGTSLANASGVGTLTFTGASGVAGTYPVSILVTDTSNNVSTTYTFSLVLSGT